MSKFGNISVGFFTTSGDGGGGGVGLTFQQCVGFGNSSTNTMAFDSVSAEGYIEIAYNQLQLIGLNGIGGIQQYRIDITNDYIQVFDFINAKDVLVRNTDIKFTDGGQFVTIAPADLFYQTISLPSTNGRLEPTQTPFGDSINIYSNSYTISATQSRSFYLESGSSILNSTYLGLDFIEGLTMYLFIPSSVGGGNVIFFGNGLPVYGLTNAVGQCGLVTINRSNNAYWVGL